MKKKIYLLLPLLAAGILFISSCGKDGAVGPRGVAGAVGPTGANGADGQPGATGATGSPNVRYSDWITVSATQYDSTLPNNSTENFYTASIIDTAIKQAILDKGTVLVYAQLNNAVYGGLWPTNQVGQLPLVISYSIVTQANVTVQETDTWSYGLSLGKLTITFVNDANFTAPATARFRYVIIPGGIHNLGSVNPNNYKQVQQALHMRD